MIDDTFRETVWRQFGAAIDTLENAINNCPDDLWFDERPRAQYWFMASHTIFWLDYYLTVSPDDFQPHLPFGLEELDPAGVIPEKPYTKDEMLVVLAHCHKKLRDRLDSLTNESALEPYRFGKRELPFAQLLLYNLRHVQHHSAQLNFILREQLDFGSPWIFQGKE